MKNLEEHREILQKALNGAGFLKRDRGEYLFVTDVPRRMARLPELPEGYTAVVRDGLMYISPDGRDVPESCRKLYLECLKADGVVREKRVRQALAVAFRQKDAVKAAFLRELADKFEIRL